LNNWKVKIMRITSEQIMRIASGADPVIVSGIVDNQDLFEKYGCDNSKRLSAFFANAGVETWGFNRLDENLYYTKASTIRKTWPTRFPSDATAAPLVRNPSGLANMVYSGRLGNTAAGDGWAYRGSGILQTTGKANFAEVERETGIQCVSNPELLRGMPEGLQAALVYWQKRDLNRFADKGDLTGLRKAIQGATHGLASVETYYKRAMTAFGAVSRPALKIGAVGSYVTELQTYLAHSGYYGGVIDGRFGQGTQRAVMDFQADHGLIADGWCGSATWAAILKGAA